MKTLPHASNTALGAIQRGLPHEARGAIVTLTYACAAPSKNWSSSAATTSGLFRGNKVSRVNRDDFGLGNQRGRALREPLRHGFVARALKNERRNQKLWQHGRNRSQNLPRDLQIAARDINARRPAGRKKGMEVLDHGTKFRHGVVPSRSAWQRARKWRLPQARAARQRRAFG